MEAEVGRGTVRPGFGKQQVHVVVLVILRHGVKSKTLPAGYQAVDVVVAGVAVVAVVVVVVGFSEERP